MCIYICIHCYYCIIEMHYHDIRSSSLPWYSGWWLTYLSEEYKSQLGLLFPIYGKRKMIQTTNQYKMLEFISSLHTLNLMLAQRVYYHVLGYWIFNFGHPAVIQVPMVCSRSPIFSSAAVDLICANKAAPGSDNMQQPGDPLRIHH